MQLFKIDQLKTVEENINILLGENDSVILSYDAVLLDHHVVDKTTPKIFVSNHYLIITYDEVVEVYLLNSLEIDFSGDYPAFNIFQQLIETRYRYDNESEADLRKMRDSEHLLKITILEEGQIPKDILIRDGNSVKRGYQNWAIGTVIRNHQHDIESNQLLYKMQDSLFYSFNTKTVTTFSILTVIYFLIRLILVPRVPDLVGTIFDVIYSILLIFMGVWLVITIKNNLDKYYALFKSYTIEEKHFEEK